MALRNRYILTTLHTFVKEFQLSYLNTAGICARAIVPLRIFNGAAFRYSDKSSFDDRELFCLC